MSLPIRDRLFLVLAVCLLLVGCGGRKLYPVSGKVTFGGKPIPAGYIYFDPDPTVNGSQGHARIKNGVYNTNERGKGIVGGPHMVRIEGYDGQSGDDLPMGKALFSPFEQKVDFPKQATVQNFDVPAQKK